MIADYGYAGLFLLFGIAFVAAAFITSWFLRPRDPNPAKNSCYECGETVRGNSWIQFNVRYYIIALIFVVFDVEILFLVPWAVIFRESGVIAFVEMMVFIAVLLAGLIYAWKKGALEWQ
ncbi:MAG: NADH-quinone oxidoreductase subunit A [Candidatus Omnitrophota bacterium]